MPAPNETIEGACGLHTRQVIIHFVDCLLGEILQLANGGRRVVILRESGIDRIRRNPPTEGLLGVERNAHCAGKHHQNGDANPSPHAVCLHGHVRIYLIGEKAIKILLKIP
jgi:hypothetical protein